MTLDIGGVRVYESSFDLRTGTIVRAVDVCSEREDREIGGQRFRTNRKLLPRAVLDELYDRFPSRSECVPSPSPELIDVGITSRCTRGCSYCYTNSTAQGRHAPKELVTKLIDGLDTPPYQIALGGGEPTGHPDFVWILEQVSARGVVPNYTTGGPLPEEVIAPTNRYCGGVALTLHTEGGRIRFLQAYEQMLAELECQINVHVLADKDVVENLSALIRLQEDTKTPINLVLLAYCPDVGRASLDRLMDRATYSERLPKALRAATASGMRIAFSEGLLPYFVSRPELGIDTAFATPCEGIFSCYVDPRGYMWGSSFAVTSKAPYKQKSLLRGGHPQKMWENLYQPLSCYCDGPCGRLARCSRPSIYLKLLCAHESHNKRP